MDTTDTQTDPAAPAVVSKMETTTRHDAEPQEPATEPQEPAAPETDAEALRRELEEKNQRIAALESSVAETRAALESKSAALDELKTQLDAKDAEITALKESAETRAAEIAAEKYAAALPVPPAGATAGPRPVEELRAEYDALKTPGEKSLFVAALSDAEANALIDNLKK